MHPIDLETQAPNGAHHALYARFSSALQNPRSIEDQLHLCREHVRKQGGTVVVEYADPASSGASLHQRPGLANLLRDAATGAFDTICVEALDRLSRDAADMADIFRRLKYRNVHLITLKEGTIEAMHIGFKGVMNQTHLDTLAHKTRRGQIGRVREGRAGGGISYGYVTANRIGADGQAMRGLRKIHPEHADIIRRIFQLYADGLSPRRIAALLNAEGIPGPSGGAWTAAGINGDRRKGTGTLNNELYRGRLVFNRRHDKRNPETGKRVAHFNPPSAWVVEDVPALRIIDEELWEVVAIRRRAGQDRRRDPASRRVPLPLSHLTECAECGGHMAIVNKGRYGCINRRERGTCEMNRRIAADVLEQRTAAAIVDWVASEQDWPGLLARAAEARLAARAALADARAETERQIVNIVSAIEEGAAARSLNQRLLELENIAARLQLEHRSLARPTSKSPETLSAELRDRLGGLEAAIARPRPRARVARHEAVMALAGLVERIVVAPDPGDRHAMTVTVTPRPEGLIALALDGGDVRRPGKRAAAMSR